MLKLNDEALKAAYAAVPADKRDMNMIATAVRAYIDADDWIGAGANMLEKLNMIEEAGIKGYLTPDFCARMVSYAQTANAYRLAEYSSGKPMI